MSDDEQIPPIARDLAREKVHSIEALEVLAALQRARELALSSAELAARLRIGESAVQAVVGALVEGELATLDAQGRAQYRPRTDELDQAVVALLDSYDRFRVETLAMISSNAIGRVRDNALRTFAEAFRVRGRKNDGER